MNYNLLLNKEILKQLGFNFRQSRLNANLSSKELALKSGISERTINGFERGENNLSLITIIELLRVLNLLDNLELLIPKIPLLSPIKLFELEQKRRKKAKKATK